MKKIILIFIFICLIPMMLSAQDKPTAAEARKVIDYYVNGQGKDAVLVDYMLCREVGQEDSDKNECTVGVAGKELSFGEEAYLWMNFLIPAGDEAKIYLSFSRNKRIRKTMDFTLTGAFRFRTWKKIPTDTPGMWTIHIFQEMANKDVDLGKITYSVKEMSVTPEE
jgi:hypothetical protein